MRITFDGRSLLNPWTGIQYYLLELVKAIQEADDSIDIVFFQDPKIKVSKEQQALVEGISGSSVYYKALTKVLINRLARRENNFFQVKTDAFHETDIYKIPTKGNGVVTVHDVIPALYPDYFPDDLYYRFMDVTKHNLAVAKKIVTDSQATKKALSFFFNVEKEKIKVIHAGVSESYAPISDHEQLAKVRTKYGLPKDYILFLGTIEPRKNIPKIITAYSKIARDLNGSKLVICGGYGWNAHKVYTTYNDLGLEDDVIFAGRVDEEDKAAIYSGAKVFVFPSIFEGFGLPPLEAMACGTPVVTSNSSSLPEVVGDAGKLVDHQNDDEIAEAILKLVKDDDMNAEFSARGIKRAKKFTWKNAADQFIELYKQIVDSRS